MRRSSESYNGSADEDTGDERRVEQLKDFVELKKFFESNRSLRDNQIFTVLITSVLLIGTLGC